jgi:DNA-binding beta-propeller fold protein YncE
VGPLPQSFEYGVAPDGRHAAAFERLRGGAFAVLVRRTTDGRVVARVPHSATLSTAAQSYEAAPTAWSRDGRRVAVAARGRGRNVLTVVDVPSGRTVLRRALRGVDLAPGAFAPDGESLVVTAGRDRTGLRAYAHAVDLRTGRIRALGRWATVGAWGGVARSPRAGVLAWGDTTQLFVADASRRQRVSARAFSRNATLTDEPLMSPDGTRIVYTVGRGEVAQLPRAVVVQDVAPRLGPPRFVVPFGSDAVFDVQWSPDGTRLVLVRS